MNITVYNISKKTNSLERPAGGTEITGVLLKTPCSVISPVLELSKLPSLCNYVYIPSFARYYWIDNIEKKTNTIDTVYLKLDVLATYREEILASSQYVLRSTSNYDTSIADTWYPQKSGEQVIMQVEQFFSNDRPGTYILGVVGKSGGTPSITGSVQYAMVTKEMLGELMDYLFSADNFTAEIVDDVVKTFFNPFQYIVDCMYFPFQFDASGDELKMGWFEPKTNTGDPIDCKYLTQTSWNGGSIDISIPRAVSDKNDYKNYAPFSSYRLYIPYFGWTEIDANLLKYDNTLELYFTLDYPTGTLMCSITGKDSLNIITTLETQCATKIPLAQVSYSQSVLSGASAIVGGLASGAGTLLSALGFDSAGDKLSGIGDSVGTATKQISTKGSIGCISQKDFEWRVMLLCTYFTSVDIDRNDFGSPCCKTLQLSTLSGYCRCLEPHIEIDKAFYQEINEIESYLSGGVYIV